MSKNSYLGRFLIWRVKNISNRNFILILSVIVGMAAGLTALALKTSVFYIRKVLLEGIDFKLDHFLLLIFPVIGIIITVLFKRFIIKDKIKHNVSSILHAISKRNSLMRRHKVFSSVLGGVFTAGFGGSIGLESPIISSGAAIGSNLGRLLRLNYKTVTLLLACGSAGAIAAIFNTPIAGIVFALEVLMIDLTRFSLIPLLMSSVTGAITTKVLFEKTILFDFKEFVQAFTLGDLPFFIVLGIITGLVSVYFTKIFQFIETRFEKINKPLKRILVGGFIIGLLIFIFPPLWGEGYDTIKLLMGNKSDVEKIFNGTFFNTFSDTVWGFITFFVLLILFKVVATATTIGSGGIGGIFAPSVFTGALTGFTFANIFNSIGFPVKLSVNNFTLVGMAGLLGGVLHAPLTGIFLIAEITSGYELIVPLMLTTTISFVTVKYFQPNSIFTMQLAQRGELITHHKDKAVLSFMKLQNVIETDLTKVNVDATLGDLVRIVAKSKRNIFPVVNNSDELIGIILIENVREIMFNQEMYDDTYVRNLMVLPLEIITSDDTMEIVMKKFNDTGAWNLPVIDKDKYVGFVSKSKLFSVYRKLLVDISDE